MRPLSFVLLFLPLFVNAADTSAPAFDQLAALDFPALKTALEKAGWPAPHVQAFLNIETQRRLNPPEIAKAADFRPFEFWRTGPDAEPLSHLNTPERTAARTRREEAARLQYDALFPPSAAPEEDQLMQAWNEQRRWGKLSSEKREAVAALLAHAEKGRDTLLQSRGGMLNLDEHRQLWKSAEQTRAEIAKLLTPAELLDYDLKNSSTANRMRSELDNFQPTQEEFLALFSLRHPLEIQFAHKIQGVHAETDRQRTEAETAVEKEIARLLGPARYDDYLLSLQPACQTLQFDGRYARADAPSIRRLYRSLLAAQKDIQKLDTSKPEYSARREKLKAELHREFCTVLDEEGARRYLQEQGLWP